MFFLAECLTVIQWGYLSDRFGRRPILLIGPLGLAITMFTFGLSRTFLPLVISRCLQGTFNGNIGVSKSVVAEVRQSLCYLVTSPNITPLQDDRRDKYWRCLCHYPPHVEFWSNNSVCDAFNFLRSSFADPFLLGLSSEVFSRTQHGPGPTLLAA